MYKNYLAMNSLNYFLLSLSTTTMSDLGRFSKCDSTFVLNDQDKYIVLKCDKNDELHQRYQKILCFNIHLLRNRYIVVVGREW